MSDKSEALRAMLGLRFGRLVVHRIVRDKNRCLALACKCDCGVERITLAWALLNGRTRSCGCLVARAHPLTRSATWNSWQAMVSRCHSPGATAYPRYGGRGISVCERWRGDQGFANFLADMGIRPEGTSIDRYPARSGNYELGNCRWATRAEQTQNSSKAALTAEQVNEIRGRAEHGERFPSIGSRFGVQRAAIRKIVRRMNWNNVP